jgi:hypothetical protein
MKGRGLNDKTDKKSPIGIPCPQCGCRHFYTTHTEPLRDGRICMLSRITHPVPSPP